MRWRTTLGAIGMCVVLVTTLAAITAVHSNAPNPPSPFTAEQLATIRAAEEQAARDKWKAIIGNVEAARKEAEREFGAPECPQHYVTGPLDFLEGDRSGILRNCEAGKMETHRSTSPTTDI